MSHHTMRNLFLFYTHIWHQVAASVTQWVGDHYWQCRGRNPPVLDGPWFWRLGFDANLSHLNKKKLVTFDSSKIGPSTLLTEKDVSLARNQNQCQINILLILSSSCSKYLSLPLFNQHHQYHKHYFHPHQIAPSIWTSIINTTNNILILTILHQASEPTSPPPAIPVAEKYFIRTLSRPEYTWRWLPSGLTAQPGRQTRWSSATSEFPPPISIIISLSLLLPLLNPKLLSYSPSSPPLPNPNPTPSPIFSLVLTWRVLPLWQPLAR